MIIKWGLIVYLNEVDDKLGALIYRGPYDGEAVLLTEKLFNFPSGNFLGSPLPSFNLLSFLFV